MREPPSGYAHVSEILDDREVACVVCEQRDAVDVGSGGDSEIDGATARLPASSFHSGGQTPPLSRDLSGDGKRLKRSLDGAEPLGSQRALIVIDGDKDTEVQLGHRGHADGRLDISR
jgi:hypothetical protein